MYIEYLNIYKRDGDVKWQIFTKIYEQGNPTFIKTINILHLTQNIENLKILNKKNYTFCIERNNLT